MRSFLAAMPENLDINSPSKVLKKDGSIKSFNSGFMFYFEKYEYDENFHERLAHLLTDKNSFMLLGKLTEFGENQTEIQKACVRRKKDKGDGFGVTLEEENKNNIMVLDLDDHHIEGWNPLEPITTIQKWLLEKEITCDVTWQITSSQKVDSELMRVRLYFLCDSDYTLEHRKAWATSEEICADGSVFSANQPIYTTPPTIEDGHEDPIQVRSGFIKGKLKHFKLPKYDEKQIQKLLTTYSEYADFDYEGELPEEVISGKVYRRFFMPYAFSLANKGLNKKDIELLINVKTSLTPREFDGENVRAYIDDAYSRIEYEETARAKKIADETEDETEENILLEDVKKLEVNQYTNHDWPEGFLGSFAREIWDRMPWPNKEIAILTSRVVTASLMGRKFSFNGLNLNQNNVLLGAQAIGKETMNWVLNKILDQLLKANPLFSSKIRAFRSGQAPKGVTALHRSMSKAPSTMILISEAGQSSKSISGDMPAVNAYTLANFAVSAHSVFTINDLTNSLPDVYGTNFVRIEEAELNSYAHNFTTSSSTSGEMARKNHHFIDHKPNKMNSIKEREFSKSIVSSFKTIFGFACLGESFDTTEKISNSKIEWKGPTLKPIKEEAKVDLIPTDEVGELIERNREEEFKIRKSTDDPYTSQWAEMARFHEKVLRECALYSAVEMVVDGGEPEVEKKHYLQAEKYIKECDRSTRANSRLFDSDNEKLVSEIFDFCREAMSKKSYIKNHTPAERNVCLIRDSFIRRGNGRIVRLSRDASNATAGRVPSEKLIKDAYEDGERLGYWEVLDGKRFDSIERFAHYSVKKNRRLSLVLKL